MQVGELARSFSGTPLDARLLPKREFPVNAYQKRFLFPPPLWFRVTLLSLPITKSDHS